MTCTDHARQTGGVCGGSPHHLHVLGWELLSAGLMLTAILAQVQSQMGPVALVLSSCGDSVARQRELKDGLAAFLIP